MSIVPLSSIAGCPMRSCSSICPAGSPCYAWDKVAWGCSRTKAGPFILSSRLPTSMPPPPSCRRVASRLTAPLSGLGESAICSPVTRMGTCSSLRPREALESRAPDGRACESAGFPTLVLGALHDRTRDRHRWHLLQGPRPGGAPRLVSRSSWHNAHRLGRGGIRANDRQPRRAAQHARVVHLPGGLGVLRPQHSTIHDKLSRRRLGSGPCRLARGRLPSRGAGGEFRARQVWMGCGSGRPPGRTLGAASSTTLVSSVPAAAEPAHAADGLERATLCAGAA